jgi:hypothetical protein
MEIKGKIKLVGEAQSFGSNGFTKREVVVITEEQYPQNILIEFTQDKCPLLDKFSAGDNVNVSINVRGREWVNPQGETKYFNSINGWKIVKDENSSPVAPATSGGAKVDDDLPF